MSGALQLPHDGSGERSPTMRHWNVAPAFVVPNANVGVGSLVRPLGPPSIVVSTPDVSTARVRVAGVGSVLPASSVARTARTCSPSVRVGLHGEAQVAHAASSTRHSKVLPGSLEENVKVGVA
ncbi:MAG: hypothetical protein PGN13_15395 [Patulibacter minatonensis]